VSHSQKGSALILMMILISVLWIGGMMNVVIFSNINSYNVNKARRSSNFEGFLLSHCEKKIERIFDQHVEKPLDLDTTISILKLMIHREYVLFDTTYFRIPIENEEYDRAPISITQTQDTASYHCLYHVHHTTLMFYDLNILSEGASSDNGLVLSRHYFLHVWVLKTNRETEDSLVYVSNYGLVSDYIRQNVLRHNYRDYHIGRINSLQLLE
jgi:hypothetical protein